MFSSLVNKFGRIQKKAIAELGGEKRGFKKEERSINVTA